jgi:hypothetical protein
MDVAAFAGECFSIFLQNIGQSQVAIFVFLQCPHFVTNCDVSFAEPETAETPLWTSRSHPFADNERMEIKL